LQIFDAAGDWLVAPLVGEARFARRTGRTGWSGDIDSAAQDVKHFEATLEPMGMRLDNDARLHELAALRKRPRLSDNRCCGDWAN
jgi:hypothetical protein